VPGGQHDLYFQQAHLVAPSRTARQHRDHLEHLPNLTGSVAREVHQPEKRQNYPSSTITTLI
jgi:hypothetical protein